MFLGMFGRNSWIGGIQTEANDGQSFWSFRHTQLDSEPTCITVRHIIFPPGFISKKNVKISLVSDFENNNQTEMKDLFFKEKQILKNVSNSKDYHSKNPHNLETKQ